MSLLAWYKLDENVLDSSGNGNHGTIQGSLTAVNGKIDKCYQFSNDANYITTNTIDHRGNVSMSAWIYPTNLDTELMASLRGIVSNHDHGTYSNFSLYIAHSKIYIDAGFTDNTRQVILTSNTILSINKWYRVSMTYNDTTKVCSIYINGNFDKKVTLVKTVKFSSGVFAIGRWAPSYPNDYKFMGNIDDVRIYDHTLSPKEVKELAKAKIVHYKFDDFIEPTENLLSSARRNIETNSSWSCYDEAEAPYHTWGTRIDRELLTNGYLGEHNSLRVYSLSSIPSGKWYGAVAWSPAPISGYEEGVKFTFSGMVRGKGNGVGKSLRLHRYSTNSTYGAQGSSSDIILTDKWQEKSLTWTNRAGDSTMVYFIINSNDFQFEFALPQVEKKDHSTPWADGERTDGSIKDSSEYGNNAEVVLASTPQWINTAKIGSGAYKFNGIQEEIANSYIIQGRSQISFSFWVNNTILSDQNRYYLSIGNLHFYRRGDWAGNKLYLLMMVTENQAGGYGDSAWQYHAGVMTQNNMVLNKWHHIVGVRDGNIMRMYIDGVKREVDVGTLTIHPNYFHALKIASHTVPDTNKAQCLIDDPRIFTTALSDDDVKELYTQRGSLDNTGKLYLNEIRVNNINSCPPFSSWSFSGGAYLDGDEVVIPSNGAKVTSPYIRIYNDTQFHLSADFYSTEESQRVAYQPNASIFGNTSYFDSIKQSTQNSQGHTGNGFATQFNKNQWYRWYGWSNVSGGQIEYLRLSLEANTTWTSPSFRAKNPMVTKNGMGQNYLPYFDEVSMTTIPTNFKMLNSGTLKTNDFSEIGPTDGLVAWYPLDGNANDMINNIDGTVSSNVTKVSGVEGLAYRFTQSGNGTVTIPKDIVDTLVNYTYSFWVKLNTGFTGSFRKFFSRNGTGSDGASDRCPGIWFYNSYNGFHIQQSVIGNQYAGPGDFSGINVGEWCHVVIQCHWDGTDTTLSRYINGTNYNQNVYTNTRPWQISANLVIGQQDCDIDDVRIYNRRLSQEEVKILYNLKVGQQKMIQGKNKLYVKGKIIEV